MSDLTRMQCRRRHAALRQGRALPRSLSILLAAAIALVACSPAVLGDGPSPAPEPGVGLPAAPVRTGGEDASIVQVANLIYAGVKSSQCFSDHFLVRAETTTHISTNRRFHSVKLASEDLYAFPMVIMTGEGDFSLPDQERKNLRRYLEEGGFLLASAGCSSRPWDRSFRREMATAFPEYPLGPLALSHPVFHTVKDIDRIRVRHGTLQPLQSLVLGTRVAVIYSPDGLNDTANATGCCCCGGNEIENAEEININVLAYALSF